MPLSPMGILHTIIGIVAIVSGVLLLIKTKRIDSYSRLGKTYLIATLITASSALTIFKHGGFNTAHALGILTILAVFSGFVVERTTWFGNFKKYAVNLCYSATMLFHMLPTATEILTRFPMGNPLVTSLEAPLLQKTFLVILIIFVVLLAFQMLWLKKRR